LAFTNEKLITLIDFEVNSGKKENGMRYNLGSAEVIETYF